MNTTKIDNEEMYYAALMSNYATMFVLAHYENEQDHDAALVGVFVRALEHATGRNVNMEKLFK
jgi:hypothetical protein